MIDVPSPNRVAVQEIWRSRQSLWRRTRTVALFYLSGPWSLWPATRIVQYAPESWWFRIGNAARSVEIGNGIDVAAIEPRASAPAWPAPILRVIAVASVATWHGYDRLLRAVHAFAERPDRPFDIHVTIVGDGPALPPLRELSTSLGLDERVTFAGTVTGPALRDLYTRSHVAVSSLGLHRIGLTRASVLKAREYCAIGIPFIASGDDPDFPSDVPFRFVVGGSEDTARPDRGLRGVRPASSADRCRSDAAVRDRSSRLAAQARRVWSWRVSAIKVLMVTGAYYPEISSGGLQTRLMAAAMRGDADRARADHGPRSAHAAAFDR